MLITFVIGLYLWTVLGLIMLYFAETQYGMQGCIAEFVVGPFTIKWEWFSPLFLFMMVSAAIAGISAMWALRKRGE
jgi:hypothetical protein